MHDWRCNCEECCWARGGEVCSCCGCLVSSCPASSLFWDDMTRKEACEAYADNAGTKDGETIFTDKDYQWVEWYRIAEKLPDNELIRWLEENYG